MTAELRRLGKYELQQCLGQGGMGEVWKAFDSQLKRHVAIKLLRSDWQNDAEFTARFIQEARLIAALRHPHIVQIHDFNVSSPADESTDLAYMVMDYVRGQTLTEFIRHTSRRSQFPSASEIVHIFTGTSLAIDYAHRHNMIHRDIKPSNVLLDQRPPFDGSIGKPVLIDFGIARIQEAAARSRTMTGSVVGTPQYIAPEQVQGQPSALSDLYSLGIILYEITTGTIPFRGETAMAILMQHVHEVPPPPSLFNPAISELLASVILKSIAKKPADRFQSATEMTIALAEALNVPVPQQLIRPGNPSSQPGIADTPYTITGTTPSRLSQSGISGSLSGSGAASLSPIHAAYPNPHTPAYSQNLVQPDHPLTPPADGQRTASPLVESPATATKTRGIRGKKSAILPIALFLLVLLGSGLASFIFFSHRQLPGPPPVSGTVTFSRSPQAAPDVYDQIELDLQNVPPPPAGKVYYAWLENANLERIGPHWQLRVEDGKIHMTLGRPYPGIPNLLRENWLVLITLESTERTPTIPSISDRLYYIQITQKSPPSFTIQSCPNIQENPNSICLQ
ncbi:MAG: serine/threonine protein kinase [Ktedonobacteraceae bacterium]|nr:serine/threonine protein kinase [Ktedonobacteraceae bacterium]